MKAQIAVETLMIYGVTLLVVILAIGALIGFGIIDFDSFFPNSCKINNALTCENYAVSKTENLVKLELKNNFGRNIANFTINIYGEGNNEGLWDCTETLYDKVLINGVVSDVINVPCTIQVPKGKKIQGVFDIKITPVGLKIPQPVDGNIRATVS